MREALGKDTPQSRIDFASSELISEKSGSGAPEIKERSRRAIVALLLGSVCGVASWLVATHIPDHTYQDFGFIWFAARAVLHGQDPYQVVLSRQYTPLFFYPLSTAVAAIPFAALPVALAGPVFTGLSCAVLAYVATRRSWWPLLMFTSGSALLTIIAAQVSALMTAAVLEPSITWIGAFKPNVGAAILASRPSWKTLIAMVGITLISLVIQPDWPRSWLTTVLNSPYHFAPWRSSGGFLLLAALAKWRLPEGRLLAAMAILPSSPIVYEIFPLFAIPRNAREMITLCISSNIVFALMVGISLQNDPASYLARAEPAMVWFAYIPALFFVMRRPNRGNMPALVERMASYAPTWLRGSRDIPRQRPSNGTTDVSF